MLFCLQDSAFLYLCSTHSCIPHKVSPVSLVPLHWGICLCPIALGPLKPLVDLPHPTVPRAGSCQAQKDPGTPLLTNSNTNLTVKGFL